MLIECCVLLSAIVLAASTLLYLIIQGFVPVAWCRTIGMILLYDLTQLKHVLNLVVAWAHNILFIVLKNIIACAEYHRNDGIWILTKRISLIRQLINLGNCKHIVNINVFVTTKLLYSLCFSAACFDKGQVNGWTNILANKFNTSICFFKVYYSKFMKIPYKNSKKQNFVGNV